MIAAVVNIQPCRVVHYIFNPLYQLMLLTFSSNREALGLDLPRTVLVYAHYLQIIINIAPFHSQKHYTSDNDSC